MLHEALQSKGLMRKGAYSITHYIIRLGFNYTYYPRSRSCVILLLLIRTWNKTENMGNYVIQTALTILDRFSGNSENWVSTLMHRTFELFIFTHKTQLIKWTQCLNIYNYCYVVWSWMHFLLPCIKTELYI